jgi:cytochrome c peroxidase
MPQPLTIEHLDKAVASLTAHIDQRFKENDDLITAFKAHVDERFDKITERLSNIEYRLNRFETRLDRFQDRTDEKFTTVAAKLGLQTLTP